MAEALTTVFRGLRKVADVAMRLTDTQIKVRDATDGGVKYGPTGTQMSELCDMSYKYSDFHEMMEFIWKRLNDDSKNFRQIYKTLLVIDYLLKSGSERVIDVVRDHIYNIKTLQDFQYIDDDGVDQGLNVRERARAIVELVQDSARLDDERKRAKAAREKFKAMGMGSGGGGFGSDDPQRFRAAASSDRHSRDNDRYESRRASPPRRSSPPPRRSDDRPRPSPPRGPSPPQSRPAPTRTAAAAPTRSAAPAGQKWPGASAATGAAPKQPATTSFFDVSEPAPQASAMQDDLFSGTHSQVPTSSTAGFGGEAFNPFGGASNDDFNPRGVSAPAASQPSAFASMPAAQPQQSSMFAPQQPSLMMDDILMPSNAPKQAEKKSEVPQDSLWGDVSSLVDLSLSDKKPQTTATTAPKQSVPLAQVKTSGKSSSTAQPTSGFGPSAGGFGAPAPGFGGPQPGFGAPMAPMGFGAPQPGFGGPQPGFGGPQPGFGAPQQGFGGMQPGFGGYPQPGYPQPGFPQGGFR